LSTKKRVFLAFIYCMVSYTTQIINYRVYTEHLNCIDIKINKKRQNKTIVHKLHIYTCFPSKLINCKTVR